MEKIDYSKYLSIDNGNGLLFNREDVRVMEFYNINYQNCNSISDLIMVISKFIDDNYDDDIEELEDVLSHLMENHYYNYVNK